MSKKLILIFVGLVFFFGFNLAQASLIFTEVMYYPSDSDLTGEWVEIYNNGSSDVLVKSDKDSYGINAWRFQKGLTEYYINSPDFTISAGEYVILANDSSLFINVLYKVIDSSVSLSNTNATNLAILDENKISVATLQYTPSADSQNNGNSLQLINEIWQAATPTPGEANETITPPPPSDDDSNDNPPVSGGSSSEIKKIEEPKIKVKITAPDLAFAGLPISLQGVALGYGGEPLRYGRYFWNFGDGDSKEVQINSVEKLTHTYFYPGEYLMTLEYYLNAYGEAPNAFDKILIKVVGADILISAVGAEKDFFVELTNNTGYSVDISNWTLSSDGKNFIFPRNTAINSKKKMIISSNFTHFSALDKNTLKLINPPGEIVFDYGASVVAPAMPIKTINKIIVQPLISASQTNQTERSFLSEELAISDEQIPAPNLEASARESDFIKNSSNNSYLPAFISIVFVGASASAVYFIRQRKIIPKTGDDFEILNE